MENVAAIFKRIALISCVFLFCIAVCEISKCTSGWFGSECQYKCHCRSGVLCDAEGQCQDGRCDQGWFGPGCQFVDLSSGIKPAHLQGDDDSSCANSTSQMDVKLAFNNPYTFTWIRVHTNNSEFLHSINIAFRNDSSLSCVNQRKALVDDRTLDIYCDINEMVQYVTLTGGAVQYLCSLYISGGRNVALHQNTSMSSTHMYGNQSYTSDKAVDGIRRGYSYQDNCSISNSSGQQLFTWTLRFSKPQNVSRYRIYNGGRRWFFSYGLITVESFDEIGNRVFSYTSDEFFYYRWSDFKEIQSNTSKIASMTIQSSEQLWLCEVEAYGDSACEPKWYGRDCEHRCNCAGDKPCFVSTGGCPSGCADGYRGEACHKPCKPGTYGPGCNMTCSKLCAGETTQERSCDFVNGACLLGCVSWHEGQHCEKPCRPGTYGPGCNITCSEFCVRGTAQERSCEFLNGTCLLGCVRGYKGETCDEQSFRADSSSSNIPLIVGISIAVAVVIITLSIAAAAVVYRRRRRKNSPPDVRRTNLPYDAPVQAQEEHNYCDVTKAGTANKSLHKPIPAEKTKSSKSNSNTYEEVITPHRTRYINQADVETVRNQVEEAADNTYVNECPLYDEIPDNIYCNVRNETAVYNNG